jgi:excinuclease ABC subunit C
MTTAQPDNTPSKPETFDWQARLKTIPHEPGVYMMKSISGEMLYIGKAKDLKRRVRQYFQEGSDTRPFVRKLPALLAEIEVLLTSTEKEALMLEANLIQQEQPRFNILLKEEQTYLYIQLDQSHDFPRLRVMRKKAHKARPKANERLFGPFLSGYAVRQMMDLIDRSFRLRTCEDHEFRNRTRPCLEYQIKRCDAPCVLPFGKDEYAAHVEEVAMLLEGKQDELLDALRERMWKAAEARAYEVAARYRDQIASVERLYEQRDEMTSGDRLIRDMIGLFREGDLVEVQIMTRRYGRLAGGRSFSFQDQEFDDNEVLENFLSAYYMRHGIELPHEILLPMEIESQSEWEDILAERANRKVNLRVPARGDAVGWIELANKNAEQSFLEKQKTAEDSRLLLEQLQRRLGLSRFPNRIECIDNSHLQGKQPVSAVVVYEGGYPNRSAYRRYHIKETKGGDDYGAMKEILTRRFRKSQDVTYPDLLLIDGGRGQLGMALSALEDLGLQDIEVIAIAKERTSVADGDVEQDTLIDRIILPNQKNAIPITGRRRELLLLSQIRDQTHDTVINFHRKIRAKEQTVSILDKIPGIGDARKKKLLHTFGSIEKVREATVDALGEIQGISNKQAQAIYDFLQANPEPKKRRKKRR